MELTKDLREFIESLNSHGVEYLIVGGYAFGFHAVPRFTRDIDLLVGASKENAPRITAVLNEFGFRSLGLTAADFDGLPVWFLDKESLIRNKRAVGRPRDLADLHDLEDR